MASASSRKRTGARRAQPGGAGPAAAGGLLAHLQLQPVRCGPLQGALLTATQVVLSCVSELGSWGSLEALGPGSG